MRILFLTPRFPWPLLRGDQVRAHEQMRVLAARHRLTLLAFDDGTASAEGQRAVGALCERVVTVPLGRAALAGALARGVLSPLPFQASLFHHRRMRCALGDLLAGDRFDLLHVQLARMGPYAAGLPLPRFVDLVDALSLSTRRRSAQHHGPLRWLTAIEAGRLLRYERRLCETLEGACVASAVDRDAIGPLPRLGVVPNGVDLARLPFEPGGREPGTVVFTGNMGYFANVNAAAWFAERVLPLVRRRVPDARFLVVGARPTARVRALATADPAVSVLGFVEDLRPHVRAAAVSVAPMQAGAGQQFKVLEAMATGTPVVATPVAAAALGVAPGVDAPLLVAESPEAFALAVVTVLSDTGRATRLATAGRRFVEDGFTWESSTAQLEALYERALTRVAS